MFSTAGWEAEEWDPPSQDPEEVNLTWDQEWAGPGWKDPEWVGLAWKDQVDPAWVVLVWTPQDHQCLDRMAPRVDPEWKGQDTECVVQKWKVLGPGWVAHVEKVQDPGWVVQGWKDQAQGWVDQEWKVQGREWVVQEEKVQGPGWEVPGSLVRDQEWGDRDPGWGDLVHSAQTSPTWKWTSCVSWSDRRVSRTSTCSPISW